MVGAYGGQMLLAILGFGALDSALNSVGLSWEKLLEWTGTLLIWIMQALTLLLEFISWFV